MPGDFDGNSIYECADIDALVAEIVSGTNDPSFDMNGDAQVDLSDLDQWRAIAGAANLPSGSPYLPGDGNLDGVVDVSDFGIWNAAKFSAEPGWCHGDFNADGVVDVSDFGIWNGSKFTSSDVRGVPEPTGVTWVIFGLATLGLGRARTERT